MASFKKTNVKIYSKPGPKFTSDTLYWKKFATPVLLKEFGPVDYIDISPAPPHYIAVTCSARVQLYHPITKFVHKNINRFQETAYGANFRSDGCLLCAGGDEPYVRLFDVNAKSLLRVFRGHTGAVHRAFFTIDNTHIASFSDDKSVILWDIPSEKQVVQYREHNDFIRTGAVSPVSSDVVLSGSYDHTIQMYDMRSATNVLTVNHGCPVESVLFLPTGGVFLSAGGTEIRVWDALAGGRLIAKMSQHHKTITCLRLASDNNRLLSGSLDKHVKIYDVSTYQVVHTFDYPSAILSMGISVQDETAAVGMLDGLVSVVRREEEVKPTKTERKKASYHYIAEGFKSTTDFIVPEVQNTATSRHDALLRKFQYTKALDKVLLPGVANLHPATTVSVFQELLRRKGLETALGGREGKSLTAVLRFLIRNIGEPRFTRTLIDVSNILLDIYGKNIEKFPESTQQFQRLHERLAQEEKLMQEMLELQGSLQMFLAGASAGASPVPVLHTLKTPAIQIHGLTPSEIASSNFVVNVT